MRVLNAQFELFDGTHFAYSVSRARMGQGSRLPGSPKPGGAEIIQKSWERS